MVWQLKCATTTRKSEMKKHACHRADYKAMNEWLRKVDWNDRLEEMKTELMRCGIDLSSLLMKQSKDSYQRVKTSEGVEF